MINNSNGTRGRFWAAGLPRSASALCHCLRASRGPFIPIRTARRFRSLLPVVPRGTAGSAAAQCSCGAGAGCSGRVAGSQPGFRNRLRDSPGREFFARSSRLVPYRELPVRRRNSVSGHVFLRDKRKRRSASAMAVHLLRFRVHLYRIVSVLGTILLLGTGLFQAACGGLKKVEGTGRAGRMPPRPRTQPCLRCPRTNSRTCASCRSGEPPG